MIKEYQLGRVAGLKLSAEPRAIVGSVVLWALLSAVGIGLLDRVACCCLCWRV